VSAELLELYSTLFDQAAREPEFGAEPFGHLWQR
jgi:hypothetical protein